jgi:HSP20 family protein
MLALRNIAPWRRRELRRTPGYALDQSINRMFDDFFTDFDRFAMRPFAEGTTFSPSIDLSETDSEIKVVAELPGLGENDVNVSLAHNVLTISGEKKDEHEEKKENFHLIERSYGSFKRSLTLPEEVDPDTVEATFKNGVLTVVLAKTTKAQEEVKKIQVKAS